MFTYSVSFSDGVKLTETSEREYTHAWAARDAFGTVAACGLANSTTEVSKKYPELRKEIVEIS